MLIPEWVFFDQGHSKGAHWQIILRNLLGPLIKQELHTEIQVKQKSRSLINSIHSLQLPLLLHCVWVFCSGCISFSCSYYAEGCVCMHSYMVLLQSETLKIMCSGWVMAARKSVSLRHMQKTFPPALTRSLWQANNTCYIFFLKKNRLCASKLLKTAACITHLAFLQASCNNFFSCVKYFVNKKRAVIKKKI